jgi:hypothetical protein
MSFHRHQMTWRDLTFNQRYLDTDPLVPPDDASNLDAAYIQHDYYLDTLDITRVSIQDYRELRQFLEGAEPNEAYEGLRAMTGRGRIVAGTHGELEDMTWAMYEQFSVAGCRLDAMTADPPGVLPLDGYRDHIDAVTKLNAPIAMRFYCRPGVGRPIIVGRTREGLVRPYAFQLLAFDPFAYSPTEHSQALAHLDGTSNVITNAGNIYTKAKFLLATSGAAGNPVTLTNFTTGAAVTLDLSGALAAQTYTLDVYRSTWKREDGSNQYAKRLSGFLSDMLLVPGDNEIRCSPAGGLASVTVKWRDAWA